LVCETKFGWNIEEEVIDQVRDGEETQEQSRTYCKVA
jgi:hypothetical protein